MEQPETVDNKTQNNQETKSPQSEKETYCRVTKTFDFAWVPERTTAEDNFKDSLYEHVRAAGISCVFIRQACLAVNIRRKGLDQATKNQLAPLFRLDPEAHYTLRRPDFMCEKAGLIIEIDGPTHDANGAKRSKDVTRDAEYRALGFNCLVLSNDAVYDSDTRTKRCQEIVAHLLQVQAKEEFNREYQRRRAALSRARRSFEKISGIHFHKDSLNEPGALSRLGTRKVFRPASKSVRRAI